MANKTMICDGCCSRFETGERVWVDSEGYEYCDEECYNEAIRIEESRTIEGMTDKQVYDEHFCCGDCYYKTMGSLIL